MRHHLGSLTGDVPDTGDLREDLLCMLRRLRQYLEEVGPDIIHGLLTELSDMPQDVFAVTPEPSPSSFNGRRSAAKCVPSRSRPASLLYPATSSATNYSFPTATSPTPP